MALTRAHSAAETAASTQSYGRAEAVPSPASPRRGARRKETTRDTGVTDPAKGFLRTRNDSLQGFRKLPTRHR